MNIAVKLALGAVFIFVAGFGVDTSITAPGYAIVHVNENSGSYSSPPCITKSDAQFMPQMTITEVRSLTLKINKECVNQGGFVQDGRSLSGQFLESIGIFSKLESRWNTDGSWNW